MTIYFYRDFLRSNWLATAMRCIPPATSLVFGLVCVLVAASAVGLMKAIWGAAAVILVAVSWSLTWRVVRFRATGYYVAALHSRQNSATIVRSPHLAICATMVAVALLSIAISAALADTSHAVTGLCCFLAISGCAVAAVYWRRSCFPLIISAEGLTDHTANVDSIAWSRITNCRIWSPKGFSIGVFIEIEPGRGWDQQRKTIGINCLDLAARPEEVLTMLELCGARKLRV